MDRRAFLNSTGRAMAASAISYGRIRGANDRISLGHIGTGARGRGLAWIVAQLKDRKNVEITAVCDLWKCNLAKAAERNQAVWGRPPRCFQYMEDLLALRDVDAVIISTADFQHAPLVQAAAEAGKDAYVEKPFANVLEEAKAARDAVLARKRVVQVGTQHRSEPHHMAVRDMVRAGALGEISKYEVVWNYHGPRWRGRPEVKEIREEDTDWRRWLLGKPWRPFDPHIYCEFRLYEEFSSGIPDQWMSHAIDLVHYFTDDHFPRSAVAHGGVFAWRDGRQNPDTFQALLEYPKGFLVSYATSFGNDCESFTRIMGKKATLINVGGEGSRQWKWVEEKGNHEDTPGLERAWKWVTPPGAEGRVPPAWVSDEEPYHMIDWLDSIRSRRQPSASVEDGFAHAVAVIMAARACREGRKFWWDPRAEAILDHPPAG